MIIIERSELKSLIAEVLRDAGVYPQNKKATLEKTYVYGQKGVAELFGCSIATASRILKSGDIAQAVSSFRRQIVVDADLALELVRVKKGGRKWKN